MNKNEIIKEAYFEFSSFERPEHFTNYTHCEECAEHDVTLQQCALHDIGSNQVGTISWNPISLLTTDAYGYVMPRLIELSLNLELNMADEFILFDWLIYITPGPENNRGKGFSKKQRLVILNTLKYIEKQIWPGIDENYHEEILHDAISVWSK